jgi:hypothetical protein
MLIKMVLQSSFLKLDQPSAAIQLGAERPMKSFYLRIALLILMSVAVSSLPGCGGADSANPSPGSISAKKSDLGGGVEKPKTKVRSKK